MSRNLKAAIERTETWPDWAQDELAELALEMDRELKGGTYRATREELRKLDEALVALSHGEVATAKEVEAVLSKYRGA